MSLSSDHSTYSTEKQLPLLCRNLTYGSHKVKYQGESPDWDFYLDVGNKPIDLSLVMPHYRARNQPIDHRMSMFVASDAASIKLKVCRNICRSKFALDVQADTSDVTIWLPSDFKGQIHHSGKASFSAGFVNRIMRNVRFNEPTYQDNNNEDDVVVYTQGHITFRMWDVQTCAPECSHKEALKRMFGCAQRAPETAIDWDFLLRD